MYDNRRDYKQWHWSQGLHRSQLCLYTTVPIDNGTRTQLCPNTTVPDHNCAQHVLISSCGGFSQSLSTVYTWKEHEREHFHHTTRPGLLVRCSALWPSTNPFTSLGSWNCQTTEITWGSITALFSRTSRCSENLVFRRNDLKLKWTRGLSGYGHPTLATVLAELQLKPHLPWETRNTNVP